MSSSPNMRNKKELIEEFIKQMSLDVSIKWEEYIKSKKYEELKKIIDEEKLKSKETIDFVNECFEKGEITTKGTKMRKILPKGSLFNESSTEQKNKIFEKLKNFFSMFYDISPSKL
jgi:type I restriction enzyme R subunit